MTTTWSAIIEHLVVSATDNVLHYSTDPSKFKSWKLLEIIATHIKICLFDSRLQDIFVAIHV